MKPKKPALPSPRKPKGKYGTGWMQCMEPEEDVIHFTRHTWVDYYIAVKTHRLFKHIPKQGQWEQFSIVTQDRKDILL